jgi:GAF domain-containing protein
VLIDHPQTLRLSDVSSQSESYGFPAGHPVIHNFLGVPIVIRGHVWGNLYLTEKAGGDFNERDEEATVLLAGWAAIAIDNAMMYEFSEARRREAERTTRGLEMTRDVASRSAPMSTSAVCSSSSPSAAARSWKLAAP